jgi:hypothetical protein
MVSRLWRRLLSVSVLSGKTSYGKTLEKDGFRGDGEEDFFIL